MSFISVINTSWTKSSWHIDRYTLVKQIEKAYAVLLERIGPHKLGLLNAVLTDEDTENWWMDHAEMEHEGSVVSFAASLLCQETDDPEDQADVSVPPLKVGVTCESTERERKEAAGSTPNRMHSRIAALRHITFVKMQRIVQVFRSHHPISTLHCLFAALYSLGVQAHGLTS